MPPAWGNSESIDTAFQLLGLIRTKAQCGRYIFGGLELDFATAFFFLTMKRGCFDVYALQVPLERAGALAEKVSGAPRKGGCISTSRLQVRTLNSSDYEPGP